MARSGFEEGDDEAFVDGDEYEGVYAAENGGGPRWDFEAGPHFPVHDDGLSDEEG